MFKIREGKMEDFKQILPIYREQHQLRVDEQPDYYKETDTPITEEYLTHVLEDDHTRMYVVENAGSLVAFTVFHYFSNQETVSTKEYVTVMVDEFYVTKENLRKGIDQHLFEKIKRFAAGKGAKEIKMEIPVSREETIEYYEERLRLKPKTKTLSYRV
ncbi:GNAT family N-acetyltransferase [Sediminibacillus massiliensis]|uniref:GNAT family N-acetyltransferase n=1 Tax=Sediminibacillus massiliensis TaxID=1926277 RepID=UPI0009883DD8|nr:GNAT family N-acetyltransferase [Sediminibacillus massiliensis]